MKLVTHKEATQILFDKMMDSIQAGLTEVAQEKKTGDTMDYNFSGQSMTSNKWICKRCTSINGGDDDYEANVCQTCYTKRDPKTKKKVLVPKNTNLREEEKKVQILADLNDEYETPQFLLDRVQHAKKGKKGKKGKRPR